MKTITITGKERNDFGKKWAKQIRLENKIPCVLYGNGKNIHFSSDEKNVNSLIFTPNSYIVNLNIDKKTEKAILKDTQFHPVEDTVLHVDFLRISEKEHIHIHIPVKVKGISVGVKNGGNLIIVMKKILIKGLIKDLPDFLEIDVTNLDINDNIKIEDLSFKNLELAERQKAIVAQVKMTRAVLPAETEVEEETTEETTDEATEETTETDNKEGKTTEDTSN